MDNDSEQGRPLAPSFRLWLCGAFRVQRRGGTTYEVIRAAEWGGSSRPRLLLKALLCCPARQARRDALLEMLWPDADPEQAIQYLNTATTKLRKVLEPSKGQASLLLTEDDYQLYRLAGQPLLWVDVDAALAVLRKVERMEGTTSEVSSLLEEALGYLDAGPFLADDDGLWLTQRRGEVEVACYHGRLRLAETYERQGLLVQAELQLRKLLAEDATDEGMLCCLMELLHRHGMTHKALRYYKEFTEVAQQEGLEPAEATKALAVHIRKERDSTQPITVSPIHNSVYALPRETIDGVPHSLELPQPVSLLTDYSGTLEPASATRTLLSLPSLFRTDGEVLTHISTVLSKCSVVGEREITYFDQQTRLYWRAREETALPATTLYSYVIRHIDDLAILLAHSHLPVLRSYLCETVCRTVLLAGILLYDMGQYSKARQHYQTAFQAATEANNPVLQAIVWGWRSFTWTYAKHYTKALHCVQQACSFASQTTDILTQAWLGAIASEIQACLGNREACLQALSEMEHGLGMSASQGISYLFECNPALFLGYRGVCLQQFYQRQQPATHGLLQEAKEALEQALESEAPLKRKIYYLSDLAGVYARQGEVETACAYVVQSLPLLRQIGSGSKAIRTHLFQVRALLRPNERTSPVRALDEQMRPLFMEMQTEDA